MATATDEWRLELRVRKGPLRDYMRYRDVNIRKLAVKVGVTKSTIGNMHSLNPNRGVFCPPDLAARIERALDAPPNYIFEPKVSRVSQDSATRARAA